MLKIFTKKHQHKQASWVLSRRKTKSILELKKIFSNLSWACVCVKKNFSHSKKLNFSSILFTEWWKLRWRKKNIQVFFSCMNFEDFRIKINIKCKQSLWHAGAMHIVWVLWVFLFKIFKSLLWMDREIFGGLRKM